MNDTTLVMDTIKGVREFHVDQYGRLRGPNQKTLWKPGWNNAVHLGMNTSHRIASAGCSCGFYAYFDKSASTYRDKTTVTGVIEGKGTVSASTEGFRAEQARIIALAPSDEDSFHWYYWFLVALLPPWSFIIMPLFVIHAVVAAIVDDVDGWWFGPALILAIVEVIFGIIGIVATASEGEEWFDWKPWNYPVQKNLLKRNYPEAQVFNSRRKMLRKIKLSESPVGPTVFGPDSEGFWNG